MSNDFEKRSLGIGAKRGKCEVCGKQMPIHANGRTKYCSGACKRKNDYVLYKKRKPSVAKEIAGNCERCGKAFTTMIPTRRFCGPECKDAAYRKVAMNLPERQCRICEKMFAPLSAHPTNVHCGPCKAEIRRTAAKQAEADRRSLGLTTMAEIVAHNATLPPLVGCDRCRRWTGHDGWCPNGEGEQ